MPASNYKLTLNAVESLRGYARNMLDKTQTLRQIGFPLTRQQVMDGVWTRDMQDALALCQANNIHINLRNDLSFICPVREGFATRVTVMTRKERLFPYLANDNNSYFDPDALGERPREAFFRWLDDTSTWFRKVEVAKKLVNEFFSGRDGGSMASIHTRWPEFAIVPLSMPEPWPTRMRSIPTIRRSEYDWPRGNTNEHTFGWYLDNARKLEIVGAMLAGAQMLGQVKDDEEVIGRVMAVIDRRQKQAA